MERGFVTPFNIAAVGVGMSFWLPSPIPFLDGGGSEGGLVIMNIGADSRPPLMAFIFACTVYPG
jgi:hypothetical protein